MARRSTYHVRYHLWQYSEERGVDVVASSAAEAYDLATYEKIPTVEGLVPYSAWVSSVTFQNGNVHYFNTCEGLPY